MRLWQYFIAIVVLLVVAEGRLRRHHRKRRFVSSHFDELYCGESAHAQSQFEEERESNSSKVSNVHSTQFNWGLDNTICIKLQNVVHVLKYERLEQRYPIESSYTFSVPLIDTNCKCHCYGFGINDVCTVEKYADDRNCTTGSEFPTCYTKYHPAVEPLDCPVTTIPAKACCDIKMKPRDGRMFRAVKLQQPINDMIITHSIFANNSGKMMKVLGPDEYRINLLKGKEQFELTEYHRISVQLVASSPQQQLREGMYYFPEENHNDLREGKINEITENDLDKLGWYRRVGNDWQVATNGLLLRNAHKVVIKNCKGQVHMDQFSGTKNFELRGTQYNDTYNERRVVENNFVRSVKVDETSREVTITHEHGTAAQVSLKTDTRPNLTKSQSILANFTGSITLDHDGNRMLNVTFYGVKGTVHIKMFTNDRKLEATFACTAQFGTTIKDDGSRISLPSNINQAQWVCILPDEQPTKAEICKWIPYEEKAMRMPRQEQSWSKGHSPCSQAECNGLKTGFTDVFPWIVNFDYFMAHGGGFTDWLKIAIHGVVIVGLIILLILLLTKCLIPLACCSLSVPFVNKNKKKSSKSPDPRTITTPGSRIHVRQIDRFQVLPTSPNPLKTGSRSHGTSNRIAGASNDTTTGDSETRNPLIPYHLKLDCGERSCSECPAFGLELGIWRCNADSGGKSAARETSPSFNSSSSYSTNQRLPTTQESQRYSSKLELDLQEPTIIATRSRNGLIVFKGGITD